jgi:Protein of unknown function (DUF1488)
MHIEFPPGETDDTREWMVWFLAGANGKQITCGISYQALRTHFGADFHNPLPAFIANRQHIEQFTATLISQGRFEEDETIVIRSHDMER